MQCNASIPCHPSILDTANIDLIFNTGEKESAPRGRGASLSDPVGLRGAAGWPLRVPAQLGLGDRVPRWGGPHHQVPHYCQYCSTETLLYCSTTLRLKKCTLIPCH